MLVVLVLPFDVDVVPVPLSVLLGVPCFYCEEKAVAKTEYLRFQKRNRLSRCPRFRIVV